MFDLHIAFSYGGTSKRRIPAEIADVAACMRPMEKASRLLSWFTLTTHLTESFLLSTSQTKSTLGGVHSGAFKVSRSRCFHQKLVDKKRVNISALSPESVPRKYPPSA